MFCSKCGKQIPDDAKFCNFCGQTTGTGSTPPPAPKPAPKRALCMNCGGTGTKRSTVKMVLSVIIFLIFISGQLSVLGGLTILASAGIAFIIFALVDMAVLYWGFKKNICPTCHGSGRINF